MSFVLVMTHFVSFVLLPSNETDTEPPMVTCPGDVESSTTNVISYSANGIGDNVLDPAILDTISYSPESLSPGSQFPTGLSIVTISVTDSAGNLGSCSFGVNITCK